MTCPLCRQRKARRACPALGHDICTVCCGTKRLTEIRCPAECPYLHTARTHPPAAVRRRQERDLRFYLSFVHDLSEAQYRLAGGLLALLRRHGEDAVPSILDADVAAAAGAVAATLETADRGIIYEHQPPSLPAQRLAAAWTQAIDKLLEHAPSAAGRDVSLALRRIERCAREASATFGGTDAFLQLIDRLAGLESPPPEAPDKEAPGEGEPASRLILP